MNMTKLAIFDLDGTLLDTAKDLGNATNYALRNCGYPERPLDDFYQLVGRGIYNLFRGAVLPRGLSNEELFKRYPSVDEGVVDKMASFFIPYYDKHKCDYTMPYPGICDMLDALEAHGVAFGVASNKYQDAVTKIIGHYFSEFSIIEAAGQRTGVPVKPDPSIVFSILLKAEIAKDDVLYVGDSGVDMETAWRACVDSVGVTWGFRTEQELRTNRATFIVHKPMQIADIVRGENLESYYNKRS